MDNDFIGIYDNGEQWPTWPMSEVVTWFINNYNTTK